MTITRRGFMYAVGAGVMLPVLPDAARAQASARRNSLQTTVAVDRLDDPASATRMIVEFGLPIKPGSLPASECIAVFDGTTKLAVQEDGRSTDRNGDIRLVTIAVLVPFQAGSTTKILSIRSEEGRPADASPELSVKDLLDIDPDAQCTVTLDVAGIPWKADFRAAASGSTKWSGKGQSFLRPGFFHNGPLRKTFTCIMPFMNRGAPHPHLYLECLATAFSKDKYRSNISWRFDPIVRNGWFATDAPQDYGMSVTITTGMASPVKRREWLSRILDSELIAAKGNVSLRPSKPGTFTIDDHGKVIQSTAARGRGLIKTISADGSSVSLVTYPAKSLADGTYAAGDITLHGVNIPRYGSYWDDDVWHGTRTQCRVRHERDYVFNSRAILNFAQPSDRINQSNGSLGRKASTEEVRGTKQLDLLGNNPLRSRAGMIGEQYQGTNEPDIRGVLTLYQIHALRKLEGDSGVHIAKISYRRLLETPYLWANHNPWQIFDDGTGLLVNGAVNDRHDAIDNNLKPPVNTHLNAYEEPQTAHSENHPFIPYLLTGRLRFLQALHEDLLRTYLVVGQVRNSAGLDRFYLKLMQVRAHPHADRIIAHAGFCTPDDMTRNVTGWSQSDIRGWQESCWNKAYARYVDDGTGKNGWSKEDPPGPPWNKPNEPVVLQTQQGMNSCYWQITYSAQLGPHLHELGMLTEKGRGYYKRFADYIVQWIVHPAIIDPAYTFGNHIGVGGGTYPLWKDYAACYASAVASNDTQHGYRALHWMALVLTEDTKLSSDPALAVKALKYAANHVFSPVTPGRGGEPDVAVPTANSTFTYQMYWVQKRTE